MNRAGPTAARLWRIAAALFCAVAAGALAGKRAGSPSASDTDARISHYQARIGGPGTYPVYARLGLAYLHKARESGQRMYYDQALRHLRQSLTYQRNFEALWGMAVALSECHSFKEAISYAEEAVDAMPSNIEAQGVVFDVRLALGQVREAQAVLNTMLGAQPGFHAFTRLAALRQYLGDYFGALDAMTHAQNDAIAHRLSATTRAWIEVRLGSLHVAQCDAEKAREAYERALALAPGYFFAKEHLAEWHAAQGHWEEARELYQELMKARPEPQYRLALGEVCRRQGKAKAARREEAKALGELRRAARGGSQDQLRPLALLLLEREAGATEGLRWALRDWEIRKDAFTADTLAWAYFCNGRSDDALRLSEEALQNGTKDPAVLLRAGLIQLRIGRAAEGCMLIDQALACSLALGPGERALAQKARVESEHQR